MIFKKKLLFFLFSPKKTKAKLSIRLNIIQHQKQRKKPKTNKVPNDSKVVIIRDLKN